MQDRDKNMEEWADRGWSDMAALLDAEMPVRRRRRWAIWWWLPLLLLPLLAASWFFFQGDQLKKRESAQLPVAQLENAKKPADTEADRSVVDSPALNIKEHTATETSSYVGKLTSDRQDGQLPPFTGEAEEPEGNFPALITAASPEKKAGIIQDNERGAPQTDENEVLIRWAEVSVIPGLARVFVSDVSPSEQPPKISARQSNDFSLAPRFWELSLQAAANPDYALGGLGAGLEAAYALGQQGWYIRPGLFYLRQKQHIGVEENSDYNLRVTEVFNNTPIPGGPFRSETLDLDVVGFTLGVSHQWTSSWSLRAGLGTGWIIEPEEIVHSQVSGEEALGQNPGGWVNADQITSELQDLRSHLVKEEGLNRQVWFATLGVSRQINTHLNVRADLQLGLNDLSRDSFFGQSGFDGLHQFRLGLGYRW